VPTLAEDPPGLRSVSIAASVLGCFAAQPELGATQVARELGVAKSTACRMLSALAASGLLDRAPGGRYRLSLRMFELGVLAAGHVAYIDRYGHAALGLQLSGETLHRVPGYSSSSGRALAAFDERIRADTLAVPRRKHTPFTITDPERLDRVLRAAREAGWVSTREEFTRGFSSVAAPVMAGPRPVAAISIVGPTTRILGLRRDFIVASVCRAAQRVSTLIGVIYAPQH